MKYFLPTSFALALALSVPQTGLAQDSSGFGKIDPTPPSGISVDDIIKKFAARETTFAQARDSYTFRQTVKEDVINDDSGKAVGEFQQVSDIVFDPQGRREEHVVFAPPNTLDAGGITMTPADLEEIEHRLPFIMTETDIPQYNVAYVGRQKVDELDTYVFDAGPKVMAKNHRYFQGRIWVDQRDFQIVLINGKTVPQDTRPGHEDLEPPFTTYYEQVDGKYWFPTYTKAEGILHFHASDGSLSEDVHLRSTVKYTDYKQFRSTSRIIYNGEDITNKKSDDPHPDQGSGQPATPAAPPK